jgi:hypothetical protein
MLSELFNESDTTLGVFYPKHYLIAVFPDLDAARLIDQNLKSVGFRQEDLITIGGAEIIELAKEETGPGSLLMQALSRFIGTEQIYADHDLHHARHGAGFVAVYCPAEETKNKAWRVIGPTPPLDARYYGSGGIEHLAGDFHTH